MMRLKLFILIIIIANCCACSMKQLDAGKSISNQGIIKIGYDISKVNIVKTETIKMHVYIYKEKVLYRMKEVKLMGDTIMLREGTYDLISINPRAEGVVYLQTESFLLGNASVQPIENDEKTLVPTNNVYYNIQINQSVSKQKIADIIFNTEDLTKKIVYEINIDGLKDAVKKCLVTQKGISKGFKLHNKEMIYGNPNEYKTSLYVDNSNKYTSSLFILGVNPIFKELEVQFVFNDNTKQTTSIDLSNIDIEDLYSKKMIINANVSVVKNEFVPIIKSWIIVKDTIKI